MATYSPPGYYRIQVSGPNKDKFIVKTGYNAVPSHLSNDSVVDEFHFDGDITIHMETMSFPGKVVGFTSDGILVKDLTIGNNHFLYTYNTVDYSSSSLLKMTDNLVYAVCFVKGTLIDTDQGPVAIESLKVGDKVVGSTGLRSVKWLGWRHYHAIALRTQTDRLTSTPVRIMAGALGNQQPTQDLCVSPWHHVQIDGVLIRANDLINGVSVVQDTHATEFSYYHVELDQFDVIRAHGVYSESWADGGNRDFFQNVDVTSLRPQDKQRRLADRPGFRVLRKAAEIAAIHARIAERAEAVFALRKTV